MMSSLDHKFRIACFSGPNLQLLGTREPSIYGRHSLGDIHKSLEDRARSLGVTVDARQSNHEGVLCDWIGSSVGSYDGIILNAAAYTHTSLALLDAIRATSLPCVEVHLSNPMARESYRHKSFIAQAAIGSICGFGINSYLLALDALVSHLSKTFGETLP